MKITITKVEPPLETLEDWKKEKLKEINDLCQKNIDILTADYPEAELLTFDKQESEARAWLKDKTLETPFLSALAVSRGLSLDELAKKVVEKADAFTLASGVLIGQRQKYEDELKKAETIQDVMKIVPEYLLPI